MLVVKFKRYLHRFVFKLSRTETWGIVKRMIYNQIDYPDPVDFAGLAGRRVGKAVR